MAKKVKITCEFCRHRPIGKQSLCKKGKETKQFAKVCELFEPLTYIWCKYHWKDINVCLKYQEKEVRGCKSCKIGKIVKHIKEEFIDE